MKHYQYGTPITTKQQISRMKQSKKYYHRSKHGKRMLATILQRTGKWIKISYDCKDEKYIHDFDIGNPSELQRFTEYDGKFRRPKTMKYPFSVGQRVKIKKYGSTKWIEAEINRFSKHSHQALCVISNQKESGIGKYWVNIYDPKEIRCSKRLSYLSNDPISRNTERNYLSNNKRNAVQTEMVKQEMDCDATDDQKVKEMDSRSNSEDIVSPPLVLESGMENEQITDEAEREKSENGEEGTESLLPPPPPMPLSPSKTIEAFQCRECGKQCRNKRSWERHIATHKKQELFQCSECTKKYKTKSGLKIHFDAKHSTESKYQCEFCRKLFKTSPQRLRHIRKEHDPEYNKRKGSK